MPRGERGGSGRPRARPRRRRGARPPVACGPPTAVVSAAVGPRAGIAADTCEQGAAALFALERAETRRDQPAESARPHRGAPHAVRASRRSAAAWSQAAEPRASSRLWRAVESCGQGAGIGVVVQWGAQSSEVRTARGGRSPGHLDDRPRCCPARRHPSRQRGRPRAPPCGYRRGRRRSNPRLAARQAEQPRWRAPPARAPRRRIVLQRAPAVCGPWSGSPRRRRRPRRGADLVSGSSSAATAARATSSPNAARPRSPRAGPPDRGPARAGRQRQRRVGPELHEGPHQRDFRP